MLFLLCFLSAQKARKRKICKKSFVLFLYYLTRLPVLLCGIITSEHIILFILNCAVCCYSFMPAFFNKIFKRGKIGHATARAIIFAEIAGKRTYIRLSERFIEAHFSFDCGVVRNKFLRWFLL